MGKLTAFHMGALNSLGKLTTFHMRAINLIDKLTTFCMGALSSMGKLTTFHMGPYLGVMYRCPQYGLNHVRLLTRALLQPFPSSHGMFLWPFLNVDHFSMGVHSSMGKLTSFCMGGHSLKR